MGPETKGGEEKGKKNQEEERVLGKEPLQRAANVANGCPQVPSGRNIAVRGVGRFIAQPRLACPERIQ